jgi:hypothetical protein
VCDVLKSVMQYLVKHDWAHGVGSFDSDIGAMVSYIFTYRDSRTIRMIRCDAEKVL